MNIQREGEILYESPSDIIYSNKIPDDDDVLTFINKIENLTYKNLVDKIRRKGYHGRTPIILPQLYQDRFEIYHMDLSEIKESKSTAYYQDMFANGLVDPYSKHTLPVDTFRKYQKYSSLAISNNTHHQIIEVDILSGKRDILKQSESTHTGHLIFNISELDYSEKIKDTKEAYQKQVGRGYFQVDVRDILNHDKFLYVPEIGKIYFSDRIEDETTIVNDLIARIQDCISIKFSHDSSIDCKFAISCQDSYGFIDKLYAIIDDEIVNINIYNTSGINTIFGEIETNDVSLNIEQTKNMIKHENTNIWMTKQVLDKETGKYKHDQKLHSLTEEMYKQDIFIIDNIAFSSSFKILKKYRDEFKKNTKKLNDKFNEIVKDFEELKDEYEKEVGKEKNFKSFITLYENVQKRNKFLSKFINYIDSKSPNICKELKDEFLNIESDDKDDIKRNMKILDDLVDRDRDKIKHDHEIELRNIKKEMEKQQHRIKMKTSNADAQHKISLRNYDYKAKKMEARTKTFNNKIDLLKTIGGAVKVLAPIAIGGLALFFGIGKMKA